MKYDYSLVKKTRKKLGLTQKDVAIKAGLNREYVSAIENGRVLPSIEMLCRIASAIGTSVSSFIENIDNNT